MKKILILLTILITIFPLTGCQSPKTDKDKIEPVVKATLDNNGNIVIKEQEITKKATYISYEYDGVVIGLIAVKDSKGDTKVIVNTCKSCGGSPDAYFIQVGDKLQCQNCRNLFDIDKLDDLEEDGCNPISIKDISKNAGIITIGTQQLKELKDKFENWKGPKE